MDGERRRRIGEAMLSTRALSRPASVAVTERLGEAYAHNGTIAVLACLAVEGPQRPQRLLEIVGGTSGGLSKLIDRLEADGVVARADATDDPDGRAVLVELTPRGRRVQRTLRSIMFAHLREAEGPIKQLLSTLDELEAVAGDLPPAGPPSHRESRVQLALARVGVLLNEAISSAPGELEPGDANAALCLCVLDQHGPSRPRLFADLLTLTTGGVSKLLDRLESAHLIQRRYGALPGDRRAVVVALTGRGRRQLATVLSGVDTHLDELCSAMVGLATELGIR